MTGHGYKIVSSTDGIKEKFQVEERKERFKKDLNYQVDHAKKINHFQLVPLSKAQVNYRHTVSGDSFTVELHLASICYSFETNIYLSTVKTQPPVELKRYIVFGVTVGDLLKYAHKAMSTEEKHQHSINDWQSTEKDKLKKAMKVETGDAALPKDFLVCCSENKNIHLWEKIKDAGFLPKTNVGKLNFTSFCNKIILFNTVAARNAASSDQCFNNLIDHETVKLILRYFLYGTLSSPETKLEFDSPKLLPEVLREMYEDSGKEDYKNALTSVMRKLNKRQQLELETKYKPTIFRDLLQVEKHYPVWALRSVLVRKWEPRHLSCIADHSSRLWGKGYDRLKYRRETCDKPGLIDIYSQGCPFNCGGGCGKCFKQWKRKEQKQQKLKDAIQEEVEIYHDP